MATIKASDFRNGKTFELDGKVMQVVEFQHVKPGKGAAFVRTKMRNVITGGVTETSFNPDDKFEEAFVERKEMSYSYQDGDLYYFMDQETFDMVPLGADLLGDAFMPSQETVALISTDCRSSSRKSSRLMPSIKMGWHMGMISGVRLAPMTPAIWATVSTSPFFMPPERIRGRSEPELNHMLEDFLS